MLKIPQNRNKLIDLLIGKLSNIIIHEISRIATDNPDISERYSKEIKASLEKAIQYRKKINPIDRMLPDKDIEYIKNKIINKTKAELKLRIEKGYKNINLELVEKLIEDILKEMNVM